MDEMRERLSGLERAAASDHGTVTVVTETAVMAEEVGVIRKPPQRVVKAVVDGTVIAPRTVTAAEVNGETRMSFEVNATSIPPRLREQP
jgi:hypothetical protein